MALGLRAGDQRLWLVGAIVFWTQVSISALNEWADADLDASANRPRPIPLGLVRRRTALLVAMVGAFLALFMALFARLGVTSILLIVLGLGCGWIYDLALKGTPFSFVPFAIAFPLLAVWVGVVAHHAPTSVPLILLGGAPLAVAIHLADAVPDREGDRAGGLRTLAVVLGRPGAELATATGLVVGCAVTVSASASLGSGLAGVLGVLLAAAAYLGLNLAPMRLAAGSAISLARWLMIGTAVALAIWLVKHA